MKKVLSGVWVFVAFCFLMFALPVQAHGGDEEGGDDPVPVVPADGETTGTAEGIAEEPAVMEAADDQHNEGVPFGIIVASAVLGIVTIGSAWLVLGKTLSIIQYSIIGIGAFTAFIHLFIGLGGETLLLLNGLGYIGLLAALYFPLNGLKGLRTPLRWGLLIYTIATLAGYFALHTPAQYDTLGLLTKAVEVALLGLLVMRLLGLGAPTSKTVAMTTNA